MFAAQGSGKHLRHRRDMKPPGLPTEHTEKSGNKTRVCHFRIIPEVKEKTATEPSAVKVIFSRYRCPSVRQGNRFTANEARPD